MLGPDHCTTIGEVAQLIQAHPLININEVVFDISKPTGDIGRFADARLALHELAWAPKVEFQVGLHELIDRIIDDRNKRLSIILPIYNDARIADAIRSVRRFDNIGTVRLVVIDGGSKKEVKDMISTLLAPGDVFISEPDDGIFDALNKGLGCCGTEFIGWLGSDDVFTGKVLAGDVVWHSRITICLWQVLPSFGVIRLDE